MTIEEFLKAENTFLPYGDKWLTWYIDEWLVLCRPYGKKNNRCLYSGGNLEEALRVLKS